MKKIFSCLLLLISAVLFADVSLKIEKNSAILENEWLRAEFANPGGRMIAFYDKQSRKNLTFSKDNDNSSGACKDQIPAIDFSFRNSDYAFQSILSSPDKCTFKVSSMNTKQQWKFQQIEREYTLEANSKVLHCRLRIINKQENMAPIIMQYWMHNYFGSPDEDNLFQFADSNNIRRFIPSDKTNGKMFISPSRNWIGMIGKSGLGVIVMPEYKRLASLYPWYCKSNGKFDTLEFRLIPESIPENSVLESDIMFAVNSKLPLISGAGREASGFLEIKNNIAQGKLYGFYDCDGKIILFADGKKLGGKNISLKTGKITDFIFPDIKISADAKLITVEFLCNNRKSFDLICGSGSIPSEKRNKSAINQEPWQYKFKYTAELPFFEWTQKENPSVLALVPLNGIQDVFELKHRRRMQVEIPVIFPGDYAMSWRISCTLPNVADKSGCDRIINFIKNKKFDTYIVGGGVFYPWNKKYNVWNSIPQNTRSKILAEVKNGAGLLIANPIGKSADIEKIMSNGRNITAEIAAKMDFSAAPFFNKAEIREVEYGKGRIIVLDCNVQGYLAPRSGARASDFSRLKYDHRFQEYQFAILAKLTDRVNGRKDEITAFSMKNDSAEIVLKNAAKITFSIFDRYTTLVCSFSRELPVGRHTLKMPDLMHGQNYIHAVSASGDFAFASAEIERVPNVRRIVIRKKDGIEAVLKINNATKDTSVEYEIRDIDDRLLKKGNGFNIKWDTKNTVSNFHKLTVLLREKGVSTARFVREFHLPEKMTASNHFANLLWNSGDALPEYIYPEYWKKFRESGFNFLYNGSPSDYGYAKLMRYSPLECGLNWLAPFIFHSSEGINNYSVTHDKKYLARKGCPSNPEILNPSECGIKKTEAMSDFSTRRIFQLGDEMSISYYNTPFDNCICQYCLKRFRQYLQEKYGTLAKLNAVWKTSFAKWTDVRPMTRIEIISHPVPAPWVEHRLFMDKVFLDAMLQCKKNIQKIYPDAIVGPTGVNHPPHVYGGNWNFRNMSQLDCASIYGPVRLPASFNRDKRLIMSYFGYTYNESETWFNVWDSLFQGARSTNNWYGPVFVMPNMELPAVRKFYRDLMWQLRSGAGDLLYNSQKITDSVGIFHSQNSLISNFLKTRKTDYWQKEKSFAHAMEDLGIDYRFIAPDELYNSKFKAIILPEASALSDKEIDFFHDFVKKGGILIADYEAGIQTELCESRAERRMDDLFGISVRRFRLLSPEPDKLSSKLEIDRVGSGVKLKNGKTKFFAVARNQNIPLLIQNNYGRGRTLLLNFSHNYAEQRSTKAGRAFLKILDEFLNLPKIAFLKSSSHAVMHHFYRNGNNIYAALLPALPHGYKNKKVGDFRKIKFDAELDFKQDGFLYEAIEGKYIGYGRNFKVKMSPAIPAIYALLPHKAEFSISAPGIVKQGDNMPVEISFPTENHRVVILRLLKPDGTEMYAARQICDSAKQQVRFCVSFALNDSPGKWQLHIKDAASGITKIHDVELQ